MGEKDNGSFFNALTNSYYCTFVGAARFELRPLDPQECHVFCLLPWEVLFKLFSKKVYYQ